MLLCSLLLGFGYDAYVAVGSDFKGETLWVVRVRARVRENMATMQHWCEKCHMPHALYLIPYALYALHHTA